MKRKELVRQAREMIEQGSTSFSAASLLLDRETRERTWLLYAWCRRCDDIADGQDMGGDLGDQTNIAHRVASIRKLTELALTGQPTGDNAFDAFGKVASEVGLTMDEADEVIAGFELDADGWRPRSEEDLIRYCYHVAGAVGVLMARVMGIPNDADEILDRACDLGIAFQLANIARDIAEDNKAGRCYLPVRWMVEQDIEPGMQMKPHHRNELAEMAERLIDLMEHHEAAAKLGAAHLRFRQRWAILAAARIYGAIGRKVRKRGPDAWNSRVYTSRLEKLGHVSAALWEAAINRPTTPQEMPRYTRRGLAALRESGPSSLNAASGHASPGNAAPG